MKNKWWPTAIFTSLCAFQQEHWVLPQRQKAVAVPQHPVRQWGDSTSVLHRTAAEETWSPKCKCGTSLVNAVLQTYSNLEHLAKTTAAAPQFVLPFLTALVLWCLFSAASWELPHYHAKITTKHGKVVSEQRPKSRGVMCTLFSEPHRSSFPVEVPWVRRWRLGFPSCPGFAVTKEEWKNIWVSQFH